MNLPLVIKPLLILIIIFSCNTCSASGWNDYILDIGDGYSILRMNEMDVCLGKDGGILHFPREQKGVGPLIHYIILPDRILTHHFGRKARNLFPGDTFEDVDDSIDYYFLVSKKSGMVEGPFPKADFFRIPDILSLGELNWKTPKNPNILLPIIGSLLFVLIAIPMLAIKYYWVTIPIIIFGILLLRRFLKMGSLKE